MRGRVPSPFRNSNEVRNDYRMTEATSAIPAATLVLFRPGAGGPEHLFVERAATMAFAAGAVVFPGGRVDGGDVALAAHYPELDADDAAARIAAIRETLEEAGLLVGSRTLLDAAATERMRRQLLDGMPFADVLAGAGVTLNLDTLVPFARWWPKLHASRIFDTRFYIARADPNAAEATVDETENVRLFWARAADALAAADAGRISMIFPTRRNLERLAQFSDFAAAERQARAIAPDTIHPWVEDRDGERYLCIPEDRGYPVCMERLETAARG